MTSTILLDTTEEVAILPRIQLPSTQGISNTFELLEKTEEDEIFLPGVDTATPKFEKATKSETIPVDIALPVQQEGVAGDISTSILMEIL